MSWYRVEQFLLGLFGIAYVLAILYMVGKFLADTVDFLAWLF